MLRLCIFLTGNLLAVFCYAQNFAWAKGEGGPGNDAANSVTTDDWGNVYMTGNIAGFADFEGTTYQGRGIYDVYIAKYDSSGNLLWVKTAGGDDNEQGNSIRYSKSFIYVAGHFSDTSWFENTMLLSKGDADMFVAKYDLDGNLVWVRQAGGPNFDWATSVDIDNAGSVYVAGSYKSSITFDTIQFSTSNIYSESFFAKYDYTGKLLWAKSVRGNNTNLITGVAYDYNNSVYLTGYFGGNFKIDNTTVSSLSPSYDILLAKIDANGNLLWMRKAGSNYEDAANAVCSDKNGNPTIVGYFAGTAQFGANSVTYHDYNDVFVARYDSVGNNLWVRAGRGQQLDIGFSITADEEGNVFATGMFQALIDFDGHVLNMVDREIFIVSYDKNGNFRWLEKAGERDTDGGLGISISKTGAVTICGYYVNRSLFGNIPLDYADGNDLFIAGLNPPVVNSLNEVENSLQLSVYPNPCSSNIHVSLNSTSSVVVRVYDATGSLLAEISSGKNTLRINTAQFVNGLYLLSVESDGIVQRKKFLVQN